jgi:hypothetical protein
LTPAVANVSKLTQAQPLADLVESCYYQRFMSYYWFYLTFLWFAVGQSSAATIAFDQPLLNSTDRGAFSVFNQQELADQFTLQSTFNIQSLTWYGSFWQTDLAPGVMQYPFVISIFESTSASESGVVQYYSLADPTTAVPSPIYQTSVLADAEPSGIPFTGTDGGLDATTRLTYAFTTDISGLALNASTEYWISITADGTTLWRWANSAVTPSAYSVERNLPEMTWDGFSNAPYNLQDRGNLAFTLYGSEVPEPAASLGVGISLGLIVLGLRHTTNCSRRNRA